MQSSAQFVEADDQISSHGPLTLRTVLQSMSRHSNTEPTAWEGAIKRCNLAGAVGGGRGRGVDGEVTTKYQDKKSGADLRGRQLLAARCRRLVACTYMHVLVCRVVGPPTWFAVGLGHLRWDPSPCIACSPRQTVNTRATSLGARCREWSHCVGPTTPEGAGGRGLLWREAEWNPSICVNTLV